MMNPQKNDSRHRTVTHSLQYLSATIVAQGVGVLRSIFLPVLFAPAQMGVWNLMGVFIGYGANAQLGILHGMNKMIPLLRGESKSGEIEVVKNSVFWLNLSLGVCAAGLFLIGAFFAPAAYFLYLCVVAVIVCVQLIFFYQFSLLRANSLFGLVSAGVVILSVCSTVCVLVFAFLFSDHVLGALVGLAFAQLCAVVYWFFKSGYRYARQIDPAAIRRSLILGVPLIILGVLDTVFVSVDRWVIAANLGVTAVGYYALGIMVNNLLSIVPGSVSSTLYPKMLERFAARKDFSDSGKLLLGALHVAAMVMIVLICCVNFAVPLLIGFFLPKYIPSIPIIKILVSGSFLYSLSTIAGTYIISINRQRYLMIIQITLIVSLIAAYTAAMKAGYGIIMTAIITASGYSLSGLSYIFLSIYFVTGKSCKRALCCIPCFMAPLALMTALMAASEMLIGAGRGGRTYAQLSGVSFLITLAIVVPVTWLCNYDKELFDILRMEAKLLQDAFVKRLRRLRSPAAAGSALREG